MMTLYNVTKDLAVGPVRCARDPISRMIGMLMTNPVKHDEPLWIMPCPAIHTFGMRHPLDVAFLNRQMHVVNLKTVKPLCPYASAPGTHSVVEFFTGRWDSSRISVGDELNIK